METENASPRVRLPQIRLERSPEVTCAALDVVLFDKPGWLWRFSGAWDFFGCCSDPYPNGCGSKNRYPKWNPWKHGPKPAVCPCCLILSHTQIMVVVGQHCSPIVACGLVVEIQPLNCQKDIHLLLPFQLQAMPNQKPAVLRS